MGKICLLLSVTVLGNINQHMNTNYQTLHYSALTPTKPILSLQDNCIDLDRIVQKQP